MRESRWYFRLTRTFQDAVIFSLDNCYWQNLRLENVFAIHMIEVSSRSKDHVANRDTTLF